MVTDSALCQFDVDSALAGNQFRLLFTPDISALPAYKLNASNPGQFFDNLFWVGEPGSTHVFTIVMPYPFVTQGATPDPRLRLGGLQRQPRLPLPDAWQGVLRQHAAGHAGELQPAGHGYERHVHGRGHGAQHRRCVPECAHGLRAQEDDRVRQGRRQQRRPARPPPQILSRRSRSTSSTATPTCGYRARTPSRRTRAWAASSQARNGEPDPA